MSQWITTGPRSAVTTATTAVRSAAAGSAAARVGTARRLRRFRLVRRIQRTIAAHRAAALLWAAIAVIVVAGALSASRAVSRAVPGESVQEPASPPLVLHDDYDTLPIGSVPGWDTSSSPKDAGTAAIVALPTSADRSVRLSLGPAGQTIVGCRTFAPVKRGELVVLAVVSLDGFGAADATIASVRAGSSEVASLRLGPGGEVRSVDPPSGRKGTGTMAPNVWYDVAFDLDAARRVYSLGVTLHDKSDLVSDQPGLRWTGLLGDGVDRICFVPPAGGAGRSVTISDLRANTK